MDLMECMNYLIYILSSEHNTYMTFINNGKIDRSLNLDFEGTLWLGILNKGWNKVKTSIIKEEIRWLDFGSDVWRSW